MSELPTDGFLVVADSPKARETVKNVCKNHEETVIRRFGRAVVFAPTEFGAFLAFWLRAKHGKPVQVARTSPVDDRHQRYHRARRAAHSFVDREHDRTPYPKFASGTDHPTPDVMRERSFFPARAPDEADDN